MVLICGGYNIHDDSLQRVSAIVGPLVSFLLSDAPGVQRNPHVTKSTGTCDRFIILGISLYWVMWDLVEVTVGIGK